MNWIRIKGFLFDLTDVDCVELSDEFEDAIDARAPTAGRAYFRNIRFLEKRDNAASLPEYPLPNPSFRTLQGSLQRAKHVTLASREAEAAFEEIQNLLNARRVGG